MIGSVSDGKTLVATANATIPDVILLDISMPMLNGLEAARQIKGSRNSTAKLVFVTVHSEMPYVVAAFRAGASGYVLKNSVATELIQALNVVAENKIYLTPLISRSVLKQLLHSKATTPALSHRQLEVLKLVAEGHTAKEIGKLLGVSPKTVDFHKGLVMKKLNLHSTAELTRYVMETAIKSARIEDRCPTN